MRGSSQRLSLLLGGEGHSATCWARCRLRRWRFSCCRVRNRCCSWQRLLLLLRWGVLPSVALLRWWLLLCARRLHLLLLRPSAAMRPLSLLQPPQLLQQ